MPRVATIPSLEQDRPQANVPFAHIHLYPRRFSLQLPVLKPSQEQAPTQTQSHKLHQPVDVTFTHPPTLFTTLFAKKPEHSPGTRGQVH